MRRTLGPACKWGHIAATRPITARVVPRAYSLGRAVVLAFSTGLPRVVAAKIGQLPGNFSGARADGGVGEDAPAAASSGFPAAGKGFQVRMRRQRAYPETHDEPIGKH